MTIPFVILIWIALSTSIAVLCGFSTWGLTPLTASASLLTGSIIPVVLLRFQKRSTELEPSRREIFTPVLTLVFAAFAIRAFGWLIFVSNDEIRVLSPNNLGDICLHLSQINYLANDPAFWPQNPIFAFEELRYPIGINLFNALLKLVGIGPQLGLVIVAFLGAALSLRALHLFNGPFGLAAFLFNGGLAGFLFFQHFALIDYQAEVAWKSIPLAMFVTQRSLLYALPAGLLLLTHWRRLLMERRSARTLPFWGEVVLYATMPLFHLHTFLFLSFLLLWWFLFGDPNWRFHLLRLVLTSLVPASVLVYRVTGFSKTGALAWNPGWMTPPEQGPWFFWLWNFGGLLPAALALTIYLCRPSPSRDRDRTQMVRWFFVPALLIFVAGGFVRFAPWEWDNTKLFIWAYLVMMFGLWTAFFQRWHPLVNVPIFVLLFFSGAISLLGGLVSETSGFQIGRRSEWEAVREATNDLPVNAVFAVQPIYNHPILVNGHRVVLGYPGHLWSHGLNYRPYEHRLNALMQSAEDWPATARELGVDFLFWGPREEAQYPASARGWENLCPVIRQGAWGRIYDLRAVGVR
jgi:hypothetical protein